jgi:hypothetical protein
MSESLVYDKPTINIDSELTTFGGDLAPVGRYKMRLLATEVKQTKAGDDFVNAIWEIQDKGDWYQSEFPVAYYTKTTISRKNPKKPVTTSRGINDMLIAFAKAGIKLTKPERETFPTEAQKLANLYAKKFGRGTYDIIVFDESYQDKATGEEKVARKARVAKPIAVLSDAKDPDETVAHETGTATASDYDDFDA